MWKRDGFQQLKQGFWSITGRRHDFNLHYIYSCPNQTQLASTLSLQSTLGEPLNGVGEPLNGVGEPKFSCWSTKGNDIVAFGGRNGGPFACSK